MELTYPEEVDRWGFKKAKKALAEVTKERHAGRGKTEPPDKGEEQEARQEVSEKPEPPGTHEHICEKCKEMGIEDNPAAMKVRMNGEERWLCETCLQEEGYSEARML